MGPVGACWGLLGPAGACCGLLGPAGTCRGVLGHAAACRGLFGSRWMPWGQGTIPMSGFASFLGILHSGLPGGPLGRAGTCWGLPGHAGACWDTHQLSSGGSNSLILARILPSILRRPGFPNPPLRAWGGIRGVRGRRGGRPAPRLGRNSPHSENTDMHTCIHAYVRRRTVGARRRANGTDVRKCARLARKGRHARRSQALLSILHRCLI